MLACDFFHVDCAVTLQRIYVFLVIEIHSRHIHILGTTANPDGPWTTQQARNLVADLEDRASDFRFLIRDRAGQFTAALRCRAHRRWDPDRQDPAPESGSKRTHAERFVRTVRAELTDRMLIFGQRHLRKVLEEYVSHYNQQRPHRGRDLQPPFPIQPLRPTQPPRSAVTYPLRPHQRIPQRVATDA
jgi:putative transposase